MDERYSRNWLYVSPEEQEKIRQYRILLGGAGIGSNIAECALRFGFERITIVDGDRVESSNLNRQNYTEKDLGRYKSEALAERLLQINPGADIRYHTRFIDSCNVEELVAGHHVAVNALDFASDMPFRFDRVCRQANIPCLHPYNIGWAGLVTVITPDSPQLTVISENFEGFELSMVEYVTQYSRFWNMPKKWLEDIIQTYQDKKTNETPVPQLSVASWIVAGYCTQIMYRLCTDKAVKTFPKFYLASVFDDHN